MFHDINVSCVNNEVIKYIHNNRIIHAKVYEILLKNEIEEWLQIHYTENIYPKQINLFWQHEFTSFDYGNLNNSILCELKTMRTSTINTYCYIDLLTCMEYKTFIDAINKNPDTLCFMFLYFSENNSMYWTQIKKDSNLEKITNVYGKQCYKINKDDFKEITLYKNYQLYLA